MSTPDTDPNPSVPIDALTEQDRELTISQGQLYGDERFVVDETEKKGQLQRYDALYVVAYVDENRVLLRGTGGEKDSSITDKNEYRYEVRDQFERARGTRFRLVERDVDAELAGLAALHDLGSVTGTFETLRQQYLAQEARAGKHKAEAITDALNFLDTVLQENVDWTSVSGIGDKTAEQITEAGFETAVDVLAASTDSLTSVSGVGPETAEALKRHAKKHQD